MNARVCLALSAVPLGIFTFTVSGQDNQPRDPAPHRVALSAEGTTAFVTERGTDSIAQIDLAQGRVIKHARTGHQPFGVATLPDGGVVVTNYGSDSLTLFDATLTPLATIAVGGEPRGVVVSPDGQRAYVALAGESTVAVVELASRKVTQRFRVGLEPWELALTAGGKRLVVGCTRGREVVVVSTVSGVVERRISLLGHNIRGVATSPDGTWAYTPFITERGRPVIKANIDLGWVVGNRLARVPLTEDGPREAISLDSRDERRGDAVGDVDGCALAPNGKTLALTAGGTHEVMLFRDATTLPFVGYGGPGDFIEPTVRPQLARISTGGRPLGAVFTPDGKKLVIANDFANAVQVIDVASAAITQTISLGGPKEPSQVRQGEMLFHDATRSFHTWYSCATCHTEGHTNGGSFDTLNDGAYGKPKKTLSLRGVALTAPYTWHGWQTNLKSAIHDSFTKSMQGADPTPAEVDAVDAYLKTLTWRKSPYSAESPAAQRGRAVFLAKGCDTCHGGPNFTSPILVKVGLEEKDDIYPSYNPPSLRNVYSRAPYLHDGRASSLESVLTEYHKPSQLSQKPDCTPTELADLVAYLQSL